MSSHLSDMQKPACQPCQRPIKIAVTGAAGQIGYALAFRLASGAILGNVPVELSLLELPQAMPSLEGVVMELEDCAFPYLKSVTATSDVQHAMQGVHYAMLVGSVPRKAGMERSDLLAINGEVFRTQGQAINQHADASVRVIVVGNPCNTNAMIAMHHAPDVPRERFFAMTALDEKRAIAQLAARAGVPVSAIRHMAIFGNHSATQYPDIDHVLIHDHPASSCLPRDWLEHTFIEAVQQRGAAVIRARGASSAASAANAALSTLSSLYHDTPDQQVFSVASWATGQYGIHDLMFSFPSRVVNGALHVVEGWEHSAFGQACIDATAQELQEEYHTVKSLGLLPR